MTAVVRWEFEDEVADETWQVPVNPNSASSPFAPKNIESSQGSSLYGLGISRLRLFQPPSAPAEWEFGGVLSTKAHHDELLRWAKKSNSVRVSDHLNRTFEVIIRQVEFTDRRPNQSNSWRMTYVMRVLVLRRVTT